MSIPTIPDKFGNTWQYHSRSDRHSKLACWGILFDLMLRCPQLREHIRAGKVVFGINHEMRDFRNDRKKKLDLVLSSRAHHDKRQRAHTFLGLYEKYGADLSAEEKDSAANLPVLHEGAVGSVLVALEAKACMTAHQRALPRLYDELNSSYQTVHGATDHALACGFAMINMATEYLSPDLNKRDLRSGATWNRHVQPRDAELAIEKIRQLPRRTRAGETGYDALGIVVVTCKNDGSNVELISEPPAPQPGNIYHYDSMIARISSEYASRFRNL